MRSSRHPTRTTLLVLGLAVIGFAVQQTAVVPAIQDVERDLHASSEWAAWLVTVYLVVATVATLAMGRLADLHGRRRMLLLGMAVFAAGSVGAALAPNVIVLILFRAVQGVGGAVYPLTLSIARDRVPEEKATAAIAVLTAGFGVGTAIGFLGGGLLAEFASWRYVFVLGAVFVAVATALVRWQVPEGDGRAGGRFDLLGTVLLGSAAVALLTALTLVVSLGWASPVVIVLLVGASMAALAWGQAERRVQNPLVDLHVLADRRVAVANTATVGLGWLLFSSYLLVPQLVRSDPGTAGYGLGGGSALVGYVLLPLAAGQTVAALGAGLSLRRLGARRVYGTGLVVLAAASALLAVDRTSILMTAIATALLGCGAGAALQAGSAVATEGVAADVVAISASVNSTTRRLAGGLGGQVSTLVLASMTTSGTPLAGAFTVSFALGGVLCLAGAVVLGLAG
ncbi:MAG TPA: MFS transporter [Pedococcus sp.]